MIAGSEEQLTSCHEPEPVSSELPPETDDSMCVCIFFKTLGLVLNTLSGHG